MKACGRIIVSTWVVGTLGFISVAVAQSPSPELARCLTHLADNPDAVLAQAEEWARHGGGLAAGECAALAQMERGEVADAARRFDALALARAEGHTVSAGDPQAEAIAAFYANAARAWLQVHQTASAASSARAGLAWSPQDLVLSTLLARAQCDQGQYAASLQTLGALPRTGRDLSDAYTLRATDRRHLNDIAGGLKDVETALDLAPDNVGALLERGILHARQGALGPARDDWDRVIALSPDTHDAYLARQDEDVLAADPDQP